MKQILLFLSCLPVILFGQFDPIEQAVQNVQPVYAIVEMQNKAGEWIKYEVLKKEKGEVEKLQNDTKLLLEKTEEIHIDQMLPMWSKEKSKRCCSSSEEDCLVWMMKLAHVEFTDTIFHYKQKEEHTTSLKIFPNPSKDFLQLESNGLTIEHIMLFDINMKLKESFSNENKIDVSELSSGQYFLQVFPADAPTQILKFEKVN